MKEKLKCVFDAVVYCVLAAIIQGVIAGIMGVVYGLIIVAKSTNSITSQMDIISGALGVTSYALAVSSVVTVIAIVLINKKKNRNLKEFFMVKNPGKKNVLVCIGLGVGVWLAANGILDLAINIFSVNIEKYQENMGFIEHSNMFISILAIGILAPIAEEVLFRLIIFKELSKKISVKWAIIIQGVMFAIYHFNLLQGVYTVFFGILFGYVTYKTKSLIPAIILHCLNNTIALVVSFANVPFNTLGLAICSIAGVGLVAWGIKKINDNNKVEIVVVGERVY